MHHQEISKIVQMMGDLSFVTDGTANVSIEHRVRSLSGNFHINGIWLVAEWEQSRLIAEIADNSKDSDEVHFYYYSNIEQDAPDAGFYIQHKDFNGEAIRFVTRAVMKASRGQIELSQLTNDSLYTGTGVTVIKSALEASRCQLSELSINH